MVLWMLYNKKKYKPQEKEGKITVKKPKEVPKKELSKEKIVVKKPIVKKETTPWNGTGERQFFNKKWAGDSRRLF